MTNWMNQPQNLFAKDETAFFCIQLEIRPSFGANDLMRLIEKKQGCLFFEYADQKIELNIQLKNELLQLLKGIDLSVPPKPAMGVDGTFFELSVYSLWNKFSFNWWGDDVDENWQPLLRLKEKIVALKRV
ncbi:hypothetical protein [Pedobacter frigiditerrae]|uniref:hypothetical protein n=1 Tax=Pedobacter frigiditerrae TaxID=2530452 RepID=UPI00293086DD|nr:hypothetical protein [Pedobacter frigiditerrae]